MEETARQHYIIGDNLRHKGFYDDGIEEFEKSLNIRQSLLSEYDIELGKTHYALGLSYKATKVYPKAFYHLHRCLTIFEYIRDHDKKNTDEIETIDEEEEDEGEGGEEKANKDGTNHNTKEPTMNAEDWITNIKLNLARTHHCQGLDYQLNGEFEKSISEHQKALGIRELYLGSKHLETARTYYVLGCALSDHGLYDQALCELRRALRTRHLIFGVAHLDTLEVVDNMITVLHAKGTYTHGIISDYKDAILKSIQYEQDGDAELDKCKGHHSTTNNIAENAENAMVCYRKSLSLEEQCLGELGPTTCDLHLKVAKTLGVLNYLDDSLDEYKNSIHVYERLLGKFHYKMGQVYIDLADVLLERDEYETSLCFYVKAYGILDATVGQHDDTKKALDKVRMAAALLTEKVGNGLDSDGDDGDDDEEEEEKEEGDGAVDASSSAAATDESAKKEDTKDVDMEDATKEDGNDKDNDEKDEQEKTEPKKGGGDDTEDDEFKDAKETSDDEEKEAAPKKGTATGGYVVDWN